LTVEPIGQRGCAMAINYSQRLLKKFLQNFKTTHSKLVAYYVKLLLRPWRGSKYCDEHICLSVCLSVCLLVYLGNHTTELDRFLRMLIVAVTRCSSGDIALRYVLRILWMTSCFCVVDPSNGASCVLSGQMIT